MPGRSTASEKMTGHDHLITATVARQRIRDLLKEWAVLSEVLTTPIVYHPGGWEGTVPEELKREVVRQRAEKLLNGGWDEATDAEVLCYLMTASLVQPLTSDWTQIFLYQGSLFMPQIREVISDTPEGLSDYQKSEVQDLKRKIRNSQLKRRKKKRKEEAMAKRKVVMEEHEGSVLVGVMQDGCDPIIKTVEGDLEAALQIVPQQLTEAQEKWAGSPRMPKHEPPKAEKAKPETEKPSEALPLLAGEKAEEKPAEEAPAVAPTEVTTQESTEELTEVLTEEPTEPVTAEEKPAEEEAKVEEPSAPAPAAEAEPAAPTLEPSAAAPAVTGEWEYYLQDGRGPFPDIQSAMDEMGLDKEERPHHGRWDRLSSQLKDQIQRRPKA